MTLLQPFCFMLICLTVYTLFDSMFKKQKFRVVLFLVLLFLLIHVFFVYLGARVILNEINPLWAFIWIAVMLGSFWVGDKAHEQETLRAKRLFDFIGVASTFCVYAFIF